VWWKWNLGEKKWITGLVVNVIIVAKLEPAACESYDFETCFKDPSQRINMHLLSCKNADDEKTADHKNEDPQLINSFDCPY